MANSLGFTTRLGLAFKRRIDRDVKYRELMTDARMRVERRRRGDYDSLQYWASAQESNSLGDSASPERGTSIGSRVTLLPQIRPL